MESQDISLNVPNKTDVSDCSTNSDLSLNLVQNLLVTLIQSKLVDSELAVKIKLNPEALKILNLVLSKCPEVINSMGSHIKKIMGDQVINSSDIPEILLLVQEVLNTNVKSLNKIKVTREQVIQMVKNIFIILIESNEIKTTPETKQSCLALLDLSIKLLESKVNVQKVIKCKFF